MVIEALFDFGFCLFCVRFSFSLSHGRDLHREIEYFSLLHRLRISTSSQTLRKKKTNFLFFPNRFQFSISTMLFKISLTGISYFESRGISLLERENRLKKKKSFFFLGFVVFEF